MNNRVLDDIKEYARRRLTEKYGYCGIAEGETSALINSGGDGEDIRVTLKIDSERSNDNPA